MSDVIREMLRNVVIALLAQEVSVELIEISRSGCLLESASRIPPGTLATLSVEIAGAAYSDDVRVARCLAVPGRGDRHHVGTEFLALHRPVKQSLRLYAASFGADGTGPDGPPFVRFKPTP